MATYKEIQAYVKEHHGFTPKTCWIAHVKELSGLKVRRAWNRKSDQRAVPCPANKVQPIREAFRHFGMLD
jgi:hypothetical protein